MALKTFNVNPEVYSKYSGFCKEHGVSMSKQVELFMEAQVADEPMARQEYLDRLERIRRGKFVKVKDFGARYGSK